MALIRLVRGMPAKHAHLSSNLTSASIVNGPLVQPGVDAALSRQRSPVQIRYGSLISLNWEVGSLKFQTSNFTLQTSLDVLRELVQRRSLNLRDCGFESRLRHKHVISGKPKSNCLYLKAQSSKLKALIWVDWTWESKLSVKQSLSMSNVGSIPVRVT